jgi:hypothetical protein
MEILVAIIIIAIWAYARGHRPHGHTYHVRTITRTRKGWGEW